MEIPYRLRVLPMLRTWTEFFLLSLALVLAACAATVAAEGDGNPRPLTPYSVMYKTAVHGLSISMSRNLESGPDNSFTFTNSGKILVAGIHEVSVFRVEGLRVLPRSYIYQGSGLINRRREVHFTPGAEAIRSLYKDQWYELPYTEDTLDRMSQQEQLRLMLLNAEDPTMDVTLRVADGKRVKDYRLVFIGEETLDTPMGKIDTLRFERLHKSPDRKSETWVAPAWDYLMVKTLHVEDGDPVEMILTEGTLDGKPIQGN